MSAHTILSKITNGYDKPVLISLSTFCALFDGKLSSEQRQELLDKVSNQLKDKK